MRGMKAREGLTIIEVLAALLVFTVGALGLAAGSAVLVRQLAGNTLRSNALAIARSRAERAIGEGCAKVSSGEEQRLGVRAIWSSSRGATLTLEQTLVRPTQTGMRSDRFVSGAMCD